MPQNLFKCTKCDRAFTMAAHLGRHMNAMHGVKGRTPKRKTGSMARGKRRVGRPRGKVGMGGPPAGSSLAHVISTMSNYHSELLTCRDMVDQEIASLSTAIGALKSAS